MHCTKGSVSGDALPYLISAIYFTNFAVNCKYYGKEDKIGLSPMAGG